MFLRSGRGEDSETVGRVGDVNWMGGSEQCGKKLLKLLKLLKSSFE